jgi:hypothetical protein
MRGWFTLDLLPAYDFPGYASVVEHVSRSVRAHGLVPIWCDKWFAGATQFASSVKELATLPLAVAFGPVRGIQLMFVVLKVASGFSMYALFVFLFRAPAAGVGAAYAYAFSMPANYATASGHLDVPVSSTLFPVILLAAVRGSRHGRPVGAVLLGAAAALQLSINHLQAGMAIAMVALAFLLRPWRHADAGRPPRASRSLGLAAATFIVLALSQLAWLATDTRHHAVADPEHIEWGVRTLIEHSPLAYVNRGNWLGPWLARHHPPGMPLFPDHPLRNQRHYLGIVTMLVCIMGWFAGRSQRDLRRTYQLFGTLLAIQYSLSMGVRTLAWQVARTLGAPESVDVPVQLALSAAALGSLAWAVALHARSRRHPRGAPVARIELALGLALFCFLAAHSTFELARRVFAPLAAVRSPGHFFDLAPFSYYAMFGTGLVAVERRFISRRLARPVLAAAVTALVALDFWPGTEAFARGTPLRPVAELRDAVAALPAPEGSAVRIGFSPWTSTESWRVASLIVSAADLGGAWSWLPWQAGRYWPAYWRATTRWHAADGGRRSDAATRELYRSMGEALGHIGRVKYFLVEQEDGEPGLGAPWRLRMQNERFTLWERSSVGPMAERYDSYVLYVGTSDLEAALAVRGALERHALVVSSANHLSRVPDQLMAGAAAVLVGGQSPLVGAPARALARRYAEKIVVVDETALGRRGPFPGPLRTAAAPAELDYRRPAPGHIVLDVPPSGRPGMVSVSEAFHPWWRATVDGRPAPIQRVQMAFMGVTIDGGARRIELRLRPPLLVRAADAITAAGWIVVTVAALGWAVRSARSDRIAGGGR